MNERRSNTKEGAGVTKNPCRFFLLYFPDASFGVGDCCLGHPAPDPDRFCIAARHTGREIDLLARASPRLARPSF